MKTNIPEKYVPDLCLDVERPEPMSPNKAQEAAEDFNVGENFVLAL